MPLAERRTGVNRRIETPLWAAGMAQASREWVGLQDATLAGLGSAGTEPQSRSFESTIRMRVASRCPQGVIQSSPDTESPSAVWRSFALVYVSVGLARGKAMMGRNLYDKHWFSSQISDSSSSAAAAVPEILRLAPEAKSVVDVGCGAGTWLEQFKLLNPAIERIYGYDGGTPDASQMRIPAESYQRIDLSEPPAPGSSGRYDLALSLEVAEHLPAEASARFVQFLTGLSDLIVFSAALPGQGGGGHINERMPSYWIGLFEAQGYECSDVLRARLWNDQRIMSYYRQNMLVAMKAGTRPDIRRIDAGNVVDVVHPQLLWEHQRKHRTRSLRRSGYSLLYGLVAGALLTLLVMWLRG